MSILEKLKLFAEGFVEGWNENVAKPGDDMFFDDTDSGFRGHNDMDLYANDNLFSIVPDPNDMNHICYDSYWGNDN